MWDDFVVPSIPEDAATDWGIREDHLMDFLEYFEKTWIGGKDLRTSNRRNPRYRHSIWNKFDAVVSTDMTTNSSEGFNHALQLSVLARFPPGNIVIYINHLDRNK